MMGYHQHTDMILPVLMAVTQPKFIGLVLDLPPSDTGVHGYVTCRCYFHQSEYKYQTKQMYENSSLRLAAYRALRSLGCPHRSGEGNSHPLSFEASDSSCFIVVCYMLQYSTHSLVVFFFYLHRSSLYTWSVQAASMISLPNAIVYSIHAHRSKLQICLLYSALKYNSLSSFSTGKMERRADFQHLMHVWQEAKVNQNKHPEGYAKHKKIIAT